MTSRPTATTRTPSRRAAAFTLVELLLAVSLMGLIFALCAGIISAVLAGSSRVASGLSEDNLAGEIEDVIAHDFAFLAPVTDQAVFSMTAESGDACTLSFYTAAGAKTAWGTVVTPIHMVTYEVKPMSSGAMGLFRGEQPLVESADAVYDAPILLADNVTLFKAEAFDGQKWQSTWPSDGSSRLPLGVRVSIDLRMPGDRKRELYIESAPPAEYGSRPQQERRSSGGEERSGSGGGSNTNQQQTNTPAGEQNVTPNAEENPQNQEPPSE